jgi:hypothetical protein
MKKTVKITGGISGVIATGSFQNLKPTFMFEETIEENGTPITDEFIFNRAKELYDKGFCMLKEAEQKAIVERIQRERKDLRFLISEKGNILPSVTSIIGFDADFFVSPEELSQYASQGNIIDAKVKHYIKTGEWVEGKKIQDVWADIVILTKGSLKLDIDVGDFPEFLKKYPISDMKVGSRFMFDEEGYCGEPDFIGLPDFKEALKIPTVFDVKRTPDKIKNGMQLAAYCKFHKITQGIIVPLNDKTAQNYSKPVIYDEKTLEGYYKMFKGKQKDFKQRYAV